MTLLDAWLGVISLGFIPFGIWSVKKINSHDVEIAVQDEKLDELIAMAHEAQAERAALRADLWERFNG